MKKPQTRPFLNAYHRKRNKRLMAQQAVQSPMTTEQFSNQMADMKRQKDEYLQQNVVQTDPATGLVHWSMWSAAPDGGFSLGHGVHYHDSARSGQDNDVVALIRGFGWLRGSDGPIRGYYIRPDSITSAEVIAELKQKIEVLIAEKVNHFRPETWITERICAAGNC